MIVLEQKSFEVISVWWKLCDESTPHTLVSVRALLAIVEIKVLSNIFLQAYLAILENCQHSGPLARL